MATTYTTSRGRRHHRDRYEEWGSEEEDDASSFYETLQAPTIQVPVKKRSVSKVRYYEQESLPQTSTLSRRGERQRMYHNASYGVPSQVSEADQIIIENTLNVPQVRPRASSTGASPHPNFLQPVYVQSQREPSRERVKHIHHHKHYDSEYSSDDSSYRSSSKQRRRRRKSSPKSEQNISPEIAKQLAKLELIEQQQRQEEYYARRQSNSKYDQNLPPDVAKRLARLELMEEQQKAKEKTSQYSSETAERLARLKALEEKKAQAEEEAAIIARMDERKRKEKEREQQLLLEYQEKQRRADLEEKEAFARAEAKRAEAESKAKTERERLIAIEKERVAKEKAERERIIAEARARQEKEEKEAEEERQRIILEEEARKKKEKEKHEALRKQFLAEEEERKKKEKQKEKEEEEEFQNKVKEKFMKAGYSPDYIEDILDEKKKALVRRASKRSENTLALEAARPTYIRVKVQYLYPETLEYYQLPWEYDPADSNYLFIKEYISHELQRELFDHTKKIRIKREKLLITDGYTKETTTVLKPANVVKDSDGLYVVRRKSTRSKSPGPSKRGSWMFT